MSRLPLVPSPLVGRHRLQQLLLCSLLPHQQEEQVRQYVCY
jgi:hypothetical protein